MTTAINVQKTSNTLLNNGFVFISGRDFLGRSGAERDLAKLALAFGQCLSSDGQSRRRSYDRNLLLPATAVDRPRLVYMSSDYRQGADVNPEAGGQIRQFTPLTREVRNNKLLRELIWLDFNLLPLGKLWGNFGRNPVEVGVHLIRMPASPGSPGVAIPNRAHRDGEFFTFIHLIKRDGVKGGESLIYRSIKSGSELVRGPLLHVCTLQDQLDTLAVWDREVFHDITPVIVADGFEQGVRDVILIDFTPTESVKVDGAGQPTIDVSQFLFLAS